MQATDRRLFDCGCSTVGLIWACEGVCKVCEVRQIVTFARPAGSWAE